MSLLGPCFFQNKYQRKLKMEKILHTLALPTSPASPAPPPPGQGQGSNLGAHPS